MNFNTKITSKVPDCASIHGYTFFSINTRTSTPRWGRFSPGYVSASSGKKVKYLLTWRAQGDVIATFVFCFRLLLFFFTISSRVFFVFVFIGCCTGLFLFCNVDIKAGIAYVLQLWFCFECKRKIEGRVNFNSSLFTNII